MNKATTIINEMVSIIIPCDSFAKAMSILGNVPKAYEPAVYKSLCLDFLDSSLLALINPSEDSFDKDVHRAISGAILNDEPYSVGVRLVNNEECKICRSVIYHCGNYDKVQSTILQRSLTRSDPTQPIIWCYSQPMSKILVAWLKKIEVPHQVVYR